MSGVQRVGAGLPIAARGELRRAQQTARSSGSGKGALRRPALTEVTRTRAQHPKTDPESAKRIAAKVKNMVSDQPAEAVAAATRNISAESAKRLR